MKKLFKDWESVINDSILNKTLLNILKVCKLKNLCPKQEDVFKAFSLCEYNNLKVVIIGQDPYFQKDMATGIAFGNHKETPLSKISPSLRALKETILPPEYDTSMYSFDYSLENWAKQGVLLLNSSLTTEMSKIGAHSSIWRAFIGDFLESLSNKNPHIAYILFGEGAKTLKPYIKKSSIILEYEHPASALRNNRRFKCDGFDKVNEVLLKNNNFKINWYE